MKKIIAILSAIMIINSCSSKPSDFESREKLEDMNWAWVWLSTFSIFQERLPSDPYSFNTPTKLYESVNDPWTVHLTGDEADAYRQYFFGGGTYYGIGVMIAKRDSLYYFKTVFANSPASRAGFRKNDIILSIDDVPMIGVPIDTVINHTRGDKNTPVEILVRRNNVDSFEQVVMRGEYLFPPVITDTLGGSIGYVDIFGFEDTSTSVQSTSDGVREALNKTRNFQVTIIDLRGNPGGLVSECMKIAGLFVDSGSPVINTEERSFRDNIGVITIDSVYRTNERNGYPARKFILLVDKGSASASEIVTATILKNRDPINFPVMGENTYGKARGQIAFDYSFEGGFFKITVMKIRTADNIDYDSVGLAPTHRLSGNPDYWLDSAYVKAREMAGLGKRAAKTVVDESVNNSIESIRINKAINRRLSPVCPEKGLCKSSLIHN
jgi:carboxyl-terminal processing protease